MNPEIKRKIDQTIHQNNVFVGDINQLLHNHGIPMENRLEIILDAFNYCLYKTEIKTDTSRELIDQIIQIIQSITIDKDEIIQILFMFYCNKKTKINLEQYYTPYSIGRFICKLMIPGKKVIDPACGTGDLTKGYDGNITLWDISENVLDVCRQNYQLNAKDYDMKCINSIEEYSRDNGTYDYCCLNPPFGSSTVVRDSTILQRYKLGRGKSKQEIGILFIERSMLLLKPGGVAFIIVPNGYLGNTTADIVEFRQFLLSFRIIGILELPSQTFARSGTGVSTSLLIVQNTFKSIPISDSIPESKSEYSIFIKSIEQIGYVLNRKNTPYKYKMSGGDYLIKDNNPVLDDDLVDAYEELSSFIKSELLHNALWINMESSKSFQTVSSMTTIEHNVLDIKRYLTRYIDTIKFCVGSDYQPIHSYIETNPITKYERIDEKEYIYLDIKQISTPIYNKHNLIYGYDLPNRAKIQVRKNDIIVSKLKGKISFTIILDEADNMICSNGFTLLRPTSYKNAVIVFANLFTETFKLQHHSLCTGSIMETVSDTELKNIFINPIIDTKKYEKIIKALHVIHSI